SPIKEIPLLLIDLREAIVAAHQCVMGCKAISKQFEVYHSTVRKIIHKWKTFKTVANLPRSGHPSKFTPRSDGRIAKNLLCWLTPEVK
uniref:Sleeping Beauty transposase HTH domain-containing protein n=1 Tax=Paramormyrops kingsleyae TaxID=1676925 RepID=A0A3B3SNV6_9TELE